MIWFATSLVIWKERNDRIFKGKEKSIYQSGKYQTSFFLVVQGQVCYVFFISFMIGVDNLFYTWVLADCYYY